MNTTVRELTAMPDPAGFCVALEEIYPPDYRIPLTLVLRHTTFWFTLRCMSTQFVTPDQILRLRLLASEYAVKALPTDDSSIAPLRSLANARDALARQLAANRKANEPRLTDTLYPAASYVDDISFAAHASASSVGNAEMLMELLEDPLWT